MQKNWKLLVVWCEIMFDKIKKQIIVKSRKGNAIGEVNGDVNITNINTEETKDSPLMIILTIIGIVVAIVIGIIQIYK